MLEVLLGADITNVVAVVTRYFGGTLLGTGGLVRAYTQAVKEALDNAKSATISFCCNIKIECAYADVNNILYYINNNDIQILNTDYLAEVTFLIRVLKDKSDNVIKQLTELTQGSSKIEIVEEGYFPFEKA